LLRRITVVSAESAAHTSLGRRPRLATIPKVRGLKARHKAGPQTANDVATPSLKPRHHPSRSRSRVMCATWCRECHPYSSVCISTDTGPFAGCCIPRFHCSSVSYSSSITQRACSASSSSVDQLTGAVSESRSIAQAFSSYGRIVGQSSVSASRSRTNAFIWLSAT